MTARTDRHPGTLTEQLAGLLERSITADTRLRAASHLLDWFGCALVGAATAPGRALARWGATGPDGRCLALGAGNRDAATAALVNGGLANILEMDDVHRDAVLHPGDTVIPAALALAERDDREGEALLDAIIRGYEAAIRIGAGVGPGHYRLWYKTATCGVFGAAAAAASLHGLDRAGMVDALGQGGMQAAGLWQCRIEPTFSKQLATGRAAQNGLVAAGLAAAGFPGAHQILEGSHGFFRAMCPDPIPQAIIADPDRHWLIHDVSFKPWPACRHVHPAIEAALAIRHSIGAHDVIARVDVRTYQDALTFADNPVPQTAHEARFSLQHCVAVALAKGAPTLSDAGPEAIAMHRDLRAKVHVAADASISAAYPKRFGAAVTVLLADGRRVENGVESAKGDPENPLAPAAITAKAEALMRAAGLSDGTIARLVASSRALAHGAPVRELTVGLATWRPTHQIL